MRRLRTAGLLALYGALSAAFCWPIFEFPNGLGVTDWDQHFFYYGSVLKNAVEYGQLPFWNPWYCGGNVLWQNPQIAFLSPVYPLTAFMSLALAMKVNILIHYWIGFVGMHLLLTRAMKLTSLPLIVYLASVFVLCGSIVLHLNAGHSVFLPAFYLPLLLFFVLRALEIGHWRATLPAGAVLALTIYNAGLHIVPIAVIAVGGIGIVASITRRRWQPLLLALLIGISGFSYSAPKLLPLAFFVEGNEFKDYRTGTEMLDRMDAPMMLRTYLDPYQNRSLRYGVYQRHKWFEYGNYVGALAVLLTVGSLTLIAAYARPPHDWLGISLAATTVLLLVMSAGEFSRVSPTVLASYLPLFSSFRVPSRYTIGVVVVAVATIAWVARWIALEAASGRLKLLLSVVCIAGTLQLLLDNRVQFAGVFPIAPLENGFQTLGRRATLDVDYTSSPDGSNSPMLRALMAGQSFYNCYESLQVRHTADRDHALVFSDDGARVSNVRFSPNRVEFSAVNGREPAHVSLNQNFARGWSSSAGRIVADGDGKPSVVLAPGQAGRYTFSFSPPGLTTGFAILGLMCAASVVLIRGKY